MENSKLTQGKKLEKHRNQANEINYTIQRGYKQANKNKLHQDESHTPIIQNSSKYKTSSTWLELFYVVFNIFFSSAFKRKTCAPPPPKQKLLCFCVTLQCTRSDQVDVSDGRWCANQCNCAPGVTRWATSPDHHGHHSMHHRGIFDSMPDFGDFAGRRGYWFIDKGHQI